MKIYLSAVLLATVFVTACATRHQALSLVPPAPDPCVSLIATLTPYTTNSFVNALALSAGVPPPHPMSEEEGQSVCAPGNCSKVSAYSTEAFKSIMLGRAGKDENNLQFQRYGDERNFVLVAIIKDEKSHTFDPRPREISLGRRLYAHVTRLGRPCGTWEVALK